MSVCISQKYNVTRRCIHCDALYLERNNIGRLLCRIHPGIKLYDKDKDNYYFSCCGLYYEDYENEVMHYNYNGLGCVKIDHISVELNKSDIVVRLSEIKSFSTLIIPSFLFSFGKNPL